MHYFNLVLKHATYIKATIMITKYQSVTVGSIEAVMCQWGIVARGQEFWIQMTTLPLTSIIIFLNFFHFIMQYT